MIYEASLSGALRIIFWFIVIVFLVRLVARMALPFVVKKSEEHLRQRMQQMQDNQRPQRPEGEITIERNNPSKSRYNGEFVDYVEVD